MNYLIAVVFVSALSLHSQAFAQKNTVVEISFAVKATPAEERDFKNKVVPWASIKHAESDAKRLIAPKLKVISARELTVVIDYPVRKPVYFRITSELGFTKVDLLRHIGRIYQQMYQEEEASSTIKTVPIDQRKGLANRNATDGKYGIWGHDIDDLDLSSATISCNKGKCFVELGIES